MQMVSTVNAFVPLIRKGDVKKMVYISSGGADIEMTRICELPYLTGYSVSKASGNIIMTKYAVDLKKDGIKTVSLSPGWVATEGGKRIQHHRPRAELTRCCSGGFPQGSSSLPVHVELFSKGLS